MKKLIKVIFEVFTVGSFENVVKTPFIVDSVDNLTGRQGCATAAKILNPMAVKNLCCFKVLVIEMIG